MTILLVEDEDRLAAALIELFHAEKYLADHADNGEDGLYAALQKDYDVIVLDVMLPKMDGFAVVHALRRAGKKTPVLMLTARDEIRDKIEGLDQGADDYMTKPFVPEELLCAGPRPLPPPRRGSLGLSSASATSASRLRRTN